MAKVYFERPMMFPPQGDDSYWELAEDWSLMFDGKKYDIPKGFRTDGASIPRFLWRICGSPMESPRVYAALVHDYLYSGGVSGTTRAEADEVYREIQRALGVSWIKAYTEWSALRVCGASHWDGD